MKQLFLLIFASLLLPAAASGLAFAESAATFMCLAPAGHVCKFAVRTASGQVDFALAAGERKDVPGVAAHADKYCVCDPGPVTPDCKAPRLDHWCLGSWVDVDTGVNSQNDIGSDRFAAGLADRANGVARSKLGAN